MIKSNKGISLVSLIITIAVMLIIASISIDMSLDRFEINNYNKMINDLELLKNKVSNYYLKYNTIPIARDDENNAIKYKYTTLEFENDQEDDNYFIIDLRALEDGISLNYGKVGFENLNKSDDVYIINERTHSIYYVKGIEMKGEYYHSILNNDSINDTIPPSKPEIKIISGTKNEEGKYTTEVKIEIIPGKDNWSGVSKTEYSVDGTTWNDLADLENNILILSEEGTYNIIAKTYDNSDKESTTDTLTIEIITVVGKAKVGTVVSENSTINGDAYSSSNPVIPKGFKAINVTTEGHESKWDAEGGPQVSEGLVISDGTSEFVWIPVATLNSFARETSDTDANGNTDYRGVLYNWGTDSTGNTEFAWSASSTNYREPANLNSTYDSTSKMSIYTPTLYQESFNKMVKSVAKYGGFYVGRYETSMNGSTAQSKSEETPMNNVNWYTMYTNSLTYSTSNTNLGVTSEMIWGCQWDAIMKFIGTKASQTGNVSHISSDFKITPYKTGGTDYSTNYKKQVGADGYVPYNDICKNIYDLEGNVREWSQEANVTNLRIGRGGAFIESNSPSNTYGGFPDGSYYYYGSRLTLYVEM